MVMVKLMVEASGYWHDEPQCRVFALRCEPVGRGEASTSLFVEATFEAARVETAISLVGVPISLSLVGSF